MADTGNLLSQEELAALASGIDDGTIAVDTGFNLTTRVKKHDLASEDSTLGVNTSSIEMINERFVRLFRMGLMEVLRTSPRINPSRAQIVRFGDYLKDLRAPLAVNTIRINPLRGFSMVTIETYRRQRRRNADQLAAPDAYVHADGITHHQNHH
jgi:flagellar motor switch protein FliM